MRAARSQTVPLGPEPHFDANLETLRAVPVTREVLEARKAAAEAGVS